LIGAELQLIPTALAAFCNARRQGVATYIEGGRRILASFLDPSSEFTLPYIHGAVSRRDSHGQVDLQGFTASPALTGVVPRSGICTRRFTELAANG
jgi:hypothetical protein